MRARLRIMGHFWEKISNDWAFNLAGMLAYNLLMTSSPLFFVTLASVGIFLGTIDPQTQATIVQNIIAALPPGIGPSLVNAALKNLQHSAGFLLVIGIVTSAFLGSRLFIVIENCFGIVYRLPSRSAIHQNVIAIGLLLSLVLSIPLFFFASLAPMQLLNDAALPTFMANLVALLLSIGGSFVVAVTLFGVIYCVVPNQRPVWDQIWPGTLAAATLFVAYERIFPWYAATFLHPQNVGSIAIFAIVILLFFYYLSLILLLGAEINSWAAGQRETKQDLPTLMHRMHVARVTSANISPGIQARIVQVAMRPTPSKSSSATPKRARSRQRAKTPTVPASRPASPTIFMSLTLIAASAIALLARWIGARRG